MGSEPQAPSTLTADLCVGGLGALCIAAGAQISVPLGPLPMTLQTLAVVLAGLVGGVRGGGLATGLYLLGVVLGWPILAGGAAAPGLAFLDLKSAGYVVGFVPAAVLVGWMGRGQPWWRMGLVALAGHGVVLSVGAPVLAAFIGWGPALQHGVLSVLPGALVKSAVAASLVWDGARVWARLRGRD